MATVLAHVKIRAGKAQRFEEIQSDLVRHTHASEPKMLRYEFWRGAEPDRYYVLLAFENNLGFYEHQASDYHERYTDELYEIFENMRLEWIDPVADGGSGLPPTEDPPLPEGMPATILGHREGYPIELQDWWRLMRR